MGAFTGTPISSVQHGRQVNLPMLFADVSDVDTRLRVSYFSYTHTATEGAGTGEVNLVRIQAGRIKVLSDLCRLVSSDMAANADLHLGFRAYTDESAGTAVAEDDNAFADNLDAGGGALDQTWPLPAVGGITLLDSQEGITIFALIDTGNIEDTDTIEGYVVYQGRD